MHFPTTCLTLSSLMHPAMLIENVCPNSNMGIHLYDIFDNYDFQLHNYSHRFIMVAIGILNTVILHL